MNDPLYHQILDRLNRDLDRDELERCACSILKDAFPTLVPVSGGSDAGMDGAIADGEGEAYPLIVTTGQDPVRNLRENLNAHLEKRFPRRKAVFATPRRLTPRQRRSLEDAARERGFVLVQVIDQEGIADRLYRNSHWCRALLGLSGTPSALSVVPASKRPLLSLEPVGREADLDWLRSTAGDRVLVGEPGSGKTFLLYHLARQGWGLFLTSDDSTAIANALRDQEPRVVIVDDAQVDPDRLARLRQLRQEVDSEFSIVAVTWRGALDQVIAALGGVPGSQVHQLELLTRNELVEVIHQVGVQDPEWVRELVSQSANKPGLAVTLADLALRGELDNILDGTVLRRTLVTALQGLVGRDPLLPLAAFSLGGNHGMGMEAVAEFLGSSRRDLREEVAGLAAGGLLSEVAERTLAVQPPVLRWNLVRTVFFSGGATDQPYRQLLERAPSFSDAVETILLAVGRARAVVPEPELQALVQRAGTAEVWQIYTALGQQRARWAVEHYPGDVVDLAWNALDQIPEVMIPKLLERAVGEEGALHSRPRHPLRILADWVKEIRVPVGEPVARRRRVATSAKSFLEKGGDRDVAIHALCLALSPAREGRSFDPGMGDTMTLSYGLLSPEELLEISAIWEEIRGFITPADLGFWQHFSTALWHWIYPDQATMGQPVPAAVEESMHAFAKQALSDLAERAGGSPGALSQIYRMSARLAKPLELDLDSDFEFLFPCNHLGGESWEKANLEQEKRVEVLAARWREKEPEAVAARLAFLEDEAKRVEHDWPRLTSLLARKVAQEVQSPEPWLAAFLSHELAGDLVEPFLEALTQNRGEGWEGTLKCCLEGNRYRGYALALVLSLDDPPPDLLEPALGYAEGFPRLIETLARRDQIPVSTLSALLQHRDRELALHAAVGEWACKPRGEVRQEVSQDWREAILRTEGGGRAVGPQYELGVILAADSQLAFDWLLRRCQAGELPSHLPDRGHDSPWTLAIDSLDRDQRVAVLTEVPAVYQAGAVLQRLVGDDVEVYRHLLALPELRDDHLHPLYGLPDESWAQKAQASLDVGYEPAQVADATVWSGVQVFGPGVEHWQKWADAFARYQDHERQDLRAVAQHGRKIAEALRDQSEKERRQMELSGFRYR